MKKVLALILCLIMCAACAESAYTGPEGSDFTVEMSDGSLFTFSEAFETYSVVVINFWGTWCPWCVKEFPYLEEAYSSYSDKIGLICLSNADSNQKIAAFMEEQGLTLLPMAYDSAGVSASVVSEGYPTTIAVNSKGELIFYHCGAILSTESFTRLFDAIIEAYPPKSNDASAETGVNTITVTDEAGAPVSGAMVNICTDTMCMPQLTDENGQVAFGGTEYPYWIHVLSVPEGYVADQSKEYTMNGSSLTITVEHN